ncbi:MAG: 4'-phosphopantetheinyl transferase superfamily protein [Conexibacteraceae bacterium]|nr:4'-phosphopantetheinyl transferase superfamily protein [Conexibacteraceae bacterium]
MEPGYDLFWLATGFSSDAELRALPRAHPRARNAAHVSQAYCAPVAMLAWHTAPLGVDIAVVETPDRKFAESICTAAELSMFDSCLDDEEVISSLLVGKRALAKALGHPSDYDPRLLESPLTWTDGAAGDLRSRELFPTPDHVAWVVWTEPAQNSADSPSSAAFTRRRAGLN